MNKIYTSYTDGGARGNPGPAAIGGVIMDKSKIITEFSEYIGSNTNNQAEYLALLRSLNLARENNIERILCYLDSELVVNQLNGMYKVKNDELIIIFNKIKSIIGKFKEVKFSHIPREKNTKADTLVNKALDS